MSPVQTNVNLDLSNLAERLSKRFDHEPELRGRIAQALLESTMNNLREIAYRLDPVLWVREVLGVEPAKWQEEFLRATRGASILALTARQCGKTTTAAWAMAHTALYVPGSLSVVACPAQRQSAEAVRRVREAVIKAGRKA
jgi:hypothetical protein